MRYNRTTGLMITQIQELVRRVNEALDEPWNKHIGRPKSLGLYKGSYSAWVIDGAIVAGGRGLDGYASRLRVSP